MMSEPDVTTTKLISAKDVAELRARTGAGMMDCKKALEEASGDLEKAQRCSCARRASPRPRSAPGASASQGLVVNYMHHNGKVGVLVELNSETDFVARTEDFGQLARDIAMHIASADPIGVSPEDIPAELVERERRIAEEQVAAEGKPEAIRAKIVEGKLKKFVAEPHAARAALREGRDEDRRATWSRKCPASWARPSSSAASPGSRSGRTDGARLPPRAPQDLRRGARR